MHAPLSPRPAQTKSRKAFWLKQLHMWHWMSSAVSLVGLLLFAITGFTLNHAADIEGQPITAERSAQLPAPLHRVLPKARHACRGALPPGSKRRCLSGRRQRLNGPKAKSIFRRRAPAAMRGLRSTARAGR